MRQKEVSLELIAISVEKELNWTIIYAQLNDVLISFCSRLFNLVKLSNSALVN